MMVSTVAAILTDSFGRVLLQQRDDKPEISFPNLWTLPGGKVEEGEVPHAAILRELEEEIGWSAPLQLWKIYQRASIRAGGSTVAVLQHIYSGPLDRTIAQLRMGEGQDLQLMDQRDVNRMALAFGFDALPQEFFTSFHRGRDPRPREPHTG